MNTRLLSVLTSAGFTQQADLIYSAPLPFQNQMQEDERELRERVAAFAYDNYLQTIARNHSIPVMDHEVDRFLKKMPEGACILDIGGCWGWHWRRLAETRPDIEVLIIDFVKSNLTHALNILGPLVPAQVALLHADATLLPFKGNAGVFDGIWTVQTFQHIPDFTSAVKEAHRVLKPGGHFINYSLNITPFNKFIYKILGKPFYSEGMVKKSFYLARANNRQLKILEEVFEANVNSRYSENFFHPDLKLVFSGREANLLGRLDAMLGGTSFIGRRIARQRSFDVRKK
jgi:ubiquinone/menaquinone biosynthesis C-methylase UbiE